MPFKNNINGARDYFEHIIKICDYTSSTQELDKIAAFLVDELSETFSANKVSFMLLDEARKELSVKASCGLCTEAACSKIKIGESFSGLAVEEDRPLLIKDVDVEFPQLAKNRLSRYASKSFMVLPVKFKDKVLGVLNVTDKIGGGVFSEDDLKALSLIGDYLALYIENSRLLEKNNKLSILDSLTGLFNHRCFYEQLAEEIYRSERYRRALAVILLDIDNFADYNKACGYSSGDNALRQVSKIIKEGTRQADIIGRYGPEELAVILPETKLKEAILAGEKIREKISDAIFTEDEFRKSHFGMTRLTISVGVVEHKIGLSKEELMRRAMCALQEAKKQGKNRLCVFK